MILRSISVSHVRCFRNPVSVGPFGDGINVLYGPNESGKSTLLEAAALGLLDRHRTGGEDIESFVPWGTSLSPEITLELEAEGRSYRLTKTFLSGHRALLAERVNGTYQDLEEGDPADTTVRGLLLGGLPGRGRARPEQWGVLRLLWSLQAPDGQGGRLVTDAVADRLRGALGDVQVRTYLGEIARRLEDSYNSIFTAHRGGLKSGSAVAQLRARIEELVEKQDGARQELEQVQVWADRLEALSRDLVRLEEERAQAKAKVESYRVSAGEVIQLRGHLKLAEAELAAQETRVKDAQRQLEGYRAQVGLHEAAREQWRELSTQQQRIHDELVGLEGRGNELRASLEGNEKLLAAARTALQQAKQIERAQALRAEVRSLTALAKGLESLAARLAKAEKLLAETPAPAKGDLKKATEAEAACHRLRAQSESLGLRVKVTAQRKQVVHFRAREGGPPEEHSLKASEETEFTAGAAASLEVPGIVELHIRSGSTEAAGVREELSKQEAALQGLLARFGVSGAADLAALAERVKAQRQAVEELRKQLEERAAPYQDEAEVRQHLATLRNQLNGIEPAAEGEEPADTDAREAEVQAAERQVQAARQPLDRNAQAVQAARTALADVERDLAVCASRRDSAKERADEFLGAATDEAGLVGVLESERTKREKMVQHVQRLTDQLPAPESDPEALMGAAALALEEIERADRKLRDEQVVLEEKVQAAESLGRYEALNVIEEGLAAKRRQLERELEHAVGLRLLRSILRERRQGTKSPALQGLEANVSRILSAVTGRAERHVRIETDFSIPGVSSDPQGGPVRDLHLLSAGTQEQLWISVRIALGETYAAGYGRQVMVLDDVLVYTDPDRHDRVLQVLRRAAGKLQIFIVTSRPALYRGLTEPEYQFDIGAL